MWTLRDLWHFFNQEAEDEWRKKQVQSLFQNKTPYPQTLQDLFNQKRDLIENSPTMQHKPPDNYLIDDAVTRHYYKPTYKGIL